MKRLAIIALLVAGCGGGALTPSAAMTVQHFAAPSFGPTTYAGNWTQLTGVAYPPGRYLFGWAVSAPSAAGCAISIRLIPVIPPPRAQHVVIAARTLTAGATDTGSATVTVLGGDYDLLIDGTGCEWKVTVTAG